MCLQDPHEVLGGRFEHGGGLRGRAPRRTPAGGRHAHRRRVSARSRDHRGARLGVVVDADAVALRRRRRRGRRLFVFERNVQRRRERISARARHRAHRVAIPNASRAGRGSRPRRVRGGARGDVDSPSRRRNELERLERRREALRRGGRRGNQRKRHLLRTRAARVADGRRRARARRGGARGVSPSARVSDASAGRRQPTRRARRRERVRRPVRLVSVHAEASRVDTRRERAEVPARM